LNVIENDSVGILRLNAGTIITLCYKATFWSINPEVAWRIKGKLNAALGYYDGCRATHPPTIPLVMSLGYRILLNEFRITAKQREHNASKYGRGR
jgi:hypothetical protein